MNPGLSEFYKNKKVLITGHTGFKGMWLSQVLDSFGSRLSGYALMPNTSPNLYEIANFRGNSFIGDIRDIDELKKAFEDEKPEIVIHLAAQPLVRASYDDPGYTYSTNIMGTVNVMECIRRSPTVKAAVIVTTDKVYENKEAATGYKETDELGGYDPYSTSKVCVEHIVRSYRRAFYSTDPGTLFATGRAGNVIGGGDWSEDRIIPDIVRSVYEKKQTIRLRKPKAIRPWQHVLEPICGYLLLAKKLYEGQKRYEGSWNFAPQEEKGTTVEELTEKAIAILGHGDYEIVDAGDKKHETGSLRLNAEKARKELGWKPLLGVDAGLDLTFSWYKRYYENGEDITKKQIKEYFSRSPVR